MARPIGMARRRNPLAIAFTVAAVGVASAAGGYAIGQMTSEDLGDVRADAAREGARQGAAAGSKRGYDAGFKAGRRQGYDRAYRRAFDGELKKAGLVP
jgi:hypothetical protein